MWKAEQAELVKQGREFNCSMEAEQNRLAEDR